MTDLTIENILCRSSFHKILGRQVKNRYQFSVKSAWLTAGWSRCHVLCLEKGMELHDFSILLVGLEVHQNVCEDA